MYNYSPILLVLHILQQEVLVETVSDTQLTKCIKARILNQLNDKYPLLDISELLNMSYFLNPRFITEYIFTSVEVPVVNNWI